MDRGRYISRYLVGILAMLLLVGPQATNGQETPAGGETPDTKAMFDVDTYPRVSGSTSTMPLGQLVAARALGLRGELRRVGKRWGFAPYASPAPVVVTFPISTPNSHVGDHLGLMMGGAAHHGTHGAYTRLIQGQADLILVARRPSADELKMAEEGRVELDVRLVALDAFVFLVNAANPVTSLSLEQVREIYSGKITGWGEVGGAEQDIVPFTRNPNSGSQELMLSLVMKDRRIVSDKRRMLMGMSGPIDRIAATRNGIAYSVYYYEHVMNRNSKNRVLAIGRVRPTPKTIASGSYPLNTGVYVVAKKSAKAESAEIRLRNWLFSAEGQEVVRDSGYITVGDRVRQTTLQSLGGQ